MRSSRLSSTDTVHATHGSGVVGGPDVLGRGTSSLLGILTQRTCDSINLDLWLD